MVEIVFIVLTLEHGKGKVMLRANDIVFVQTSPSSSIVWFKERPSVFVEESPEIICNLIEDSRARVKNV